MNFIMAPSIPALRQDRLTPREDVLLVWVAGAAELGGLLCDVPEVQVLGTGKSVICGPDHETQPCLWPPSQVCPHDGSVDHSLPCCPSPLLLLADGFDFIVLLFHFYYFRDDQVLPVLS